MLRLFSGEAAPARLALLAVVVLVANRPAFSIAPPDARPTQSQVKAVAAHLTHFATRSIINNRPLHWFGIPRDLLAEQAQLMTDLKQLSRDPDELRRLLSDADPRVRTVALGALFVREDPKDLPYIAKQIGDHAVAIQDLHESMRAGGEVPREEIEGPQTVGQVAGAMIGFYLRAAHVLSLALPGAEIRENEIAPIFDTYWAARKDRAHCASWFLVKLERATRQTEPLLSEYRDDVDMALEKIYALPSPDRDWTLLYALFGEGLPGPAHVVPSAVVRHAAVTIGPVNLMKFLLLEPFSADPDLHFTKKDFGGAIFISLAGFILNDAAYLLRPSDAADLRANAFKERMRSPGAPSWIAASDWLLGMENPARGAEQLKADFALFPQSSQPWPGWEQLPLAVNLWRLSGARDKEFLVDWFYASSLKEDPNIGAEFLHAVDAEERPDTPELLKEIVADSRFDKTSWSILAHLLHSPGGRNSEPLLPKKDIYAYMPNPSRDDETVVFASWRNLLRRYYRLPEKPRPGAN